MGRPKLHKVQKHFRMDAEAVEKLDELARKHGYIFARTADGREIPAMGEFLESIAYGDLIVIAAKKILEDHQKEQNQC